jgi:indolepyruvate ferredoxin oxidoreductase beta subunit
MVGVGGQGIIMASDILSEALLAHGYDVKKSEVHGMAQRGGSVNTHVRFGKKVFSPLIRKGEVDILYSLELLESVRYISYLNKDSVIILNDYRQNPPSVSLGKDEYPDGIYELFKENFSKVTLIDGLSMATKAGNAKAVSSVILGHLSLYLDISKDRWFSILEGRLPKKVVDVNFKAFDSGRDIDKIQ